MTGSAGSAREAAHGRRRRCTAARGRPSGVPRRRPPPGLAESLSLSPSPSDYLRPSVRVALSESPLRVALSETLSPRLSLRVPLSESLCPSRFSESRGPSPPDRSTAAPGPLRARPGHGMVRSAADGLRPAVQAAGRAAPRPRVPRRILRWRMRLRARGMRRPARGEGGGGLVWQDLCLGFRCLGLRA